MKKHLKEDPSKVVFLDIDGVLNSDNFFTSKYHDRLLQMDSVKIPSL